MNAIEQANIEKELKEEKEKEAQEGGGEAWWQSFQIHGGGEEIGTTKLYPCDFMKIFILFYLNNNISPVLQQRTSLHQKTKRGWRSSSSSL